MNSRIASSPGRAAGNELRVGGAAIDPDGRDEDEEDDGAGGGGGRDAGNGPERDDGGMLDVCDAGGALDARACRESGMGSKIARNF